MKKFENTYPSEANWLCSIWKYAYNTKKSYGQEVFSNLVHVIIGLKEHHDFFYCIIHWSRLLYFDASAQVQVWLQRRKIKSKNCCKNELLMFVYRVVDCLLFSSFFISHLEYM